MRPARRGFAHFRLPALALVLAVALSVVPIVPIRGQAPAARDLLWKATGSRGTLYLVGSIHLLTKEYYPLGPALDRAFEGSSLLVEEVDFGEMLATDAQLQMLTKGMLPAGQSLESVLSPATFAFVGKRLADLGVPLAPLARFKPWMLSLTLLGLEWQKAGFDPDLGLDKHFYDRARAVGKPVQGLETLPFQISMFDGMTPAQQDRLLAETLKELDTEKASLTELANAWKSGDASVVERVVLRDLKDEPQIYQRLLLDRNRSWIPAIEALFSRPQPAFVVVGAAHVVGPDGLVAMLKAKGYTVVQQ
jgi:uncharacterized protein YbaP (TraB family)